MKLSDREEEILETLWTSAEEEKKEPVSLGVSKGESALEELAKSGHIRLDGDRIILLEKGKTEGRKIVRRHRLSERLFADVLDIKKKLVHPVSCLFEHVIHEDIEENICVLLGHPKTCPHGKPIPEGECCRKSKETIARVVSSLADLKAKQKGKIAYIQTKDHKKLQKLMIMGALPGVAIKLIQKFPSYVFQVGQSQFAVDKELAESVYVRVEGQR